jgi:hypothetical protein
MVNIIKKIALAAMESVKPAEVRIGEILSVSPIEIKIGEKLIIKAPRLIFPEHTPKAGNWLVPHVHSFIVDGAARDTSEELSPLCAAAPLDEGDRLILLRAQGGEFYVVLGRATAEF